MTNIEDNIRLLFIYATLNAKIFIILQQKPAVSTIGQICTTVCQRKFRNKSHLLKTFYQLHAAGKTWSCLDRNTGFLDNKNPITDKNGCAAYFCRKPVETEKIHRDTGNRACVKTAVGHKPDRKP